MAGGRGGWALGRVCAHVLCVRRGERGCWVASSLPSAAAVSQMRVSGVTGASWPCGAVTPSDCAPLSVGMFGSGSLPRQSPCGFQNHPRGPCPRTAAQCLHLPGGSSLGGPPGRAGGNGPGQPCQRGLPRLRGHGRSSELENPTLIPLVGLGGVLLFFPDLPQPGASFLPALSVRFFIRARKRPPYAGPVGAAGRASVLGPLCPITTRDNRNLLPCCFGGRRSGVRCGRGWLLLGSAPALPPSSRTPLLWRLHLLHWTPVMRLSVCPFPPLLPPASRQQVTFPGSRQGASLSPRQRLRLVGGPLSPGRKQHNKLAREKK